MKTEVLELLVPKLQPFGAVNNEFIQVVKNALQEKGIVEEKDIFECVSQEFPGEPDALASGDQGEDDSSVPISKDPHAVDSDPITDSQYHHPTEPDSDEDIESAPPSLYQDGVFNIPQDVKFCRYYRKEDQKKAYFARHMCHHAKGPRYICERCSRIFACPTHYSLHQLINNKSSKCSLLLPGLLPKLNREKTNLNLGQETVRKKPNIGPVNLARSREICAQAFYRSQCYKTSQLPSHSTALPSLSPVHIVSESSLQNGVDMDSFEEKYSVPHSFHKTYTSEQSECETSPHEANSPSPNSVALTSSANNPTNLYTVTSVPTTFACRMPSNDQIILHQNHTAADQEISYEDNTGKFPTSTSVCNNIQKLCGNSDPSLQKQPVTNYTQSSVTFSNRVPVNSVHSLCDSDGKSECKKLCVSETNVPEDLYQSDQVTSLATSLAPMGFINRVSNAPITPTAVHSSQVLNPANQDNSVTGSFNTSNLPSDCVVNQKMNQKSFCETLDFSMQPTQMGCVPYTYADLKTAGSPVGSCSSTVWPTAVGNCITPQPMYDNTQFLSQLAQNNNFETIILNNQSLGLLEDQKTMISPWVSNPTPAVVYPAPSVLVSPENFPGMQFPAQCTPQFVNVPQDSVPFNATVPAATQLVVMNPSMFPMNPCMFPVSQSTPYEIPYPVSNMQNQVPMSGPMIETDQPCIFWQGPVTSIQTM